MSKTPEPIRVPTLAEADPDYAALVAKKDELGTLHSALTREKAALWRDRGKTVAPKLPNRVAALLGDEVEEETISPAVRFSHVKRELAEVVVAQAEIDKRLRAARGPASHKACEMVRKPFVAAAVRLADALLETHKAHLAMTDLIEEFECNDVNWSSYLPNISATSTLGHPRDVSGRLAYWLRGAVEAGVIKATEMPEVLR